jgi:methylase of polypeptide subunit release factors
MLRTPSFETVRTTGKFLADSGYDVPGLADGLDLTDSLYANLENLAPLLEKTGGDSILPVLARLFFVGWPTDEQLCRRVIPERILADAFESGLLRRSDSNIEATAILLPFRGLLVACDAPRLRVENRELIIGPSPSTHLIARLAAGGAGETTLDLGTGSGVLALEAAHYSDSVTGIDINPRFQAFAEFNAALNGISGVRFVCGDAFQPVKERRFSRIIANPPFFLGPAKEYTYSDSPLELDGFTRYLAEQAHGYLEEGGYFQMICEWVELEGQPWEKRLRQWAASSGCDVLVMVGPRLSPVNYAEKRSQEAKRLHGGSATDLFSKRSAYFEERGLRGILGGVISMRKRRGANWFSTVGLNPTGDSLGETVRERFRSLDFLAMHGEDELLAAKYRLAADAGLDQRQALTPEGWQIVSSELSRKGCFQDRLGLDSVVAGFLPLFDGKRTVFEIAGLVAESLPCSLEEARQRCLQLLRRLLQSGFVQPMNERAG